MRLVLRLLASVVVVVIVWVAVSVSLSAMNAPSDFVVVVGLLALGVTTVVAVLALRVIWLTRVGWSEWTMRFANWMER